MIMTRANDDASETVADNALDKIEEFGYRTDWMLPVY